MRMMCVPRVGWQSSQLLFLTHFLEFRVLFDLSTTLLRGDHLAIEEAIENPDTGRNPIPTFSCSHSTL